MKLRHVSTQTPWEEKFGYARAVRAGGFIAVSGTVAAGTDGRPTAPDAYGQAAHVFRILDDVLQRLGSRLEDTVRLRVYYSDPQIGPDFARALREAFSGPLPALTGVRVAALVDPGFLLEVEADAVVGDWVPEHVPPSRDWDEPVD